MVAVNGKPQAAVEVVDNIPMVIINA